MNDSLIQIEDLSLSFSGSNAVLKGIDLVVNANEIVAVVGESGSGKSVTAMSLMQLLDEKIARYPSGKIVMRPSGQSPINLLDCSEKELQKIRGGMISMIFQNPMSALNPSIICGKQVAEIISIHQDLSKAEIEQEVLSLFKKVKLPDVDRIYNSYPHQLSGGQLQRIIIAMAIANKPSLIIADEPTTALDVTIQREILMLLKELQQEHKCAILFISHDLGLVKELAEKVIVMYQGEIVECGNTKQIFSTPAHAYTKGLLSCRPPLNIKLDRLPVLDDFLVDKPSKNKASVQLKKNATAEDVLVVSNLKKYFVKKKNFFGMPTDFTKAVENVSFKIKKGESVGLVGESGSGKSTIGNCLLKLTPIDGGSMIYEGDDITDLRGKDLKRFRKNFQVIFQDPYSSLNPRMKIGNAILEPILAHNIASGEQAKEKVYDLLEKVGLEKAHYERYPHEFSGGQRQRINIARALAVEPEFIICDECVSALDVSVQAQILNLLKDLQQELGLSYLFITHDFSVVRFICDRVLVLREGEIVEEGSVADIIDKPAHGYTQKLISSIV